MANENNDICDIVKKCKILLLDIEGTTTSISFVKDKLFPYAEENVKEFLDKQWDNDEVKETVAALRKLALEDQENKVEGAVVIPGEDTGKDEQIEGLVKNVKWQMSADRKVGPLKQLQGLIWKMGYDKGDIKGHVFEDVSAALEQWRSVEGQKVYIYSSGSVQAQKLLFGQSVAGDLLPMIEGHFDTAVGAKQEAASYVSIAEKIGCKPEEILFLTDVVKEAEAARASGLQAALVSREGNAPLPADAASAFPVVHSFEQLTVSNKRKPEHQDEEEVPAKVPKTDIEDNVKSASDEAEATPVVESNETAEKPTTMETNDAPATDAAQPTETPVAPEKPAETPASTETAEPEKMEVEEETPIVAEAKEQIQKPAEKPAEKEEAAPVRVETIVEEITDTKDVVEECEMEPIVEESAEKTEQTETEKMDAEPVAVADTAAKEPKEPTAKTNEKTVVAEETPPTVITEIEEVTNEQDTLNEVIEDLVPVVEEPINEDLEVLQNVGEVLEKECDEILSKVQDVTNLDSIPIKPLLNTIVEETMETENTDTNDIVERILDTEMELGMKPCDDIDLNTVQEITDEKIETPEETTEKVSAEEKVDVPENNTENVVKDDTKDKIEESPAPEKTEEKANETKVEAVSNGDAKVETPAPVEETKESTKMDIGAAGDTKPDVTEKQESSETKESAAEKVMEIPKIEITECKVEENGTAKAEEPATEVATEKVAEEVKEKENKVNGKATNGDVEVNLNGNASKDEELNARLSVENGKEPVNGANGDSAEEKGQGDSKIDTEASDIKVKTVAVDEPRTDPIEQPTEA